MSYANARVRGANGEINKLYPEDQAIHRWYRFVLSFPPHLIRDYLQRFGMTGGRRVLDPFCGTGTVLVECKKLGIPSAGVEANPVCLDAGEVCERLRRRWRCVELTESYLEAAVGRFGQKGPPAKPASRNPEAADNYFRLPRPGVLWNGAEESPLPQDGGRSRHFEPAVVPARPAQGEGKRAEGGRLPLDE